jgi:hypothetical protein
VRLLVWVFVLGCGARSVGTCIDRGDCGDLQICDNDACKKVECIESADCGLGRYCEDYTCKDGCGSNDDCLAGETCSDAHACESYQCRTSALDCGLGEKCNPASGACEAAPGCNRCTDDAQCGVGGICSDWLPGPGVDRYCLVPCTVAGDPEQCGRGLECRDLSGVGDLFCYADCPTYRTEVDGK